MTIYSDMHSDSFFAGQDAYRYISPIYSDMHPDPQKKRVGMHIATYRHIIMWAFFTLTPVLHRAGYGRGHKHCNRPLTLENQ